MSLEHKNALVTGAGSGIGRASAIRLAREGATVGLLDVDEDDLRETAAEIEQQGLGKCRQLVVDLTDVAALKSAIEGFGDEVGALHVVFANAGINGVWAPLEALTVEEFDRTVQVNLRGSFATIKYSWPYMKEEGGSIIITSSINGTRLFSNSGATAYSCTKAAQVAMGRMLAVELGPSEVRVNTICPGGVKTHISENTETRDLEHAKIPVKFPEGNTPLAHGGPADPERLADLVYFLASDASSHISGAEIYIDGAESLLQG
jgi:NAD(P)-dependent dehydrogenase (short-subunit alcohol dehydrogenase family)